MITKKRLLKNSKERQHKEVNLDDVKILSKNFKTNEKRKISEALLIRSFKPTLNVQPWSIHYSMIQAVQQPENYQT